MEQPFLSFWELFDILLLNPQGGYDLGVVRASYSGCYRASGLNAWSLEAKVEYRIGDEEHESEAKIIMRESDFNADFLNAADGGDKPAQ